MDAITEVIEDDTYFATHPHSKLDSDEHFHNFGLDFKCVVSHLSKKQNNLPNTLGGDSVSIQLKKAFDQFLHTDLLSSECPNQSSDSVTVGGNSNSSHHAQRDSQLVFLSGYPGPGPSSSLISTYNINLEFWRRHLGFMLAASTSQFEDIKVPSAICDIFQLRIWTIGHRGIGARIDQASVESLRKHSATLMENYRERLSTGSSFRTGDSVVRKYEVHDQEYFSIEQLLTIYVSTAHERDTDGKKKSWLGESFG